MGSGARRAGVGHQTPARNATKVTSSLKGQKIPSAFGPRYKNWRKWTLAKRGLLSASDLDDGGLSKPSYKQARAIRKPAARKIAKSTMEGLEQDLLHGRTSDPLRTPWPRQVLEENEGEKEDYAHDEHQVYTELEEEMEQDSEGEAAMTLESSSEALEEYDTTNDLPLHNDKDTRVHSETLEEASSVSLGDKHVHFMESEVTDLQSEQRPPGQPTSYHNEEQSIEESSRLPDLEIIDLNEIYDYSVDYRGDLKPPEGPVQKLEFPKLSPAKTQVQQQQEVVKEWEKLVEQRKRMHPENENLIQHTMDRVAAHRARLEVLVAEEPFLPQYRDQRIEILEGCLERYVNADEIVNVKAAIKAYEDGVLTNSMDQWTVFYNGNIVDKINSHRDLLWGVRKPLYEEVYGKRGAIWIEPPSNDQGTACATLFNETMVSGECWSIEQTLCLPWYDTSYAKTFEFLLDTGATDVLLHESDILDLGLIKQDCPHIASRNLITPLGSYVHDFYPIFIQHRDPDAVDDYGNQIALYPFMDTIVGILASAGCYRLSGIDLFRFCYVATEPSTGRLSYVTALDQISIRPGIMPGGTLTPRAWYTRQWDARTSTFVVSNTVCSLTGRLPRLLNPEGARWVSDEPSYPYQYGRDDRSPHKFFTYLPGHKLHPPTPDDVRADRKYQWTQGQAYRDNRPFIDSSRKYSPPAGQWDRNLGYGYPKPGFSPRLSGPSNPWQYKLPEEAWAAPNALDMMYHLPKDQEAVVYWDDNLPATITQQGLSPLIIP